VLRFESHEPPQRDLRAETHDERVFMCNHEAIGLTHAVVDQFFIERNDGGQIEYFERYAFVLLLREFERLNLSTLIPNYDNVFASITVQFRGAYASGSVSRFPSVERYREYVSEFAKLRAKSPGRRREGLPPKALR
jgi:hypothetical protein